MRNQLGLFWVLLTIVALVSSIPEGRFSVISIQGRPPATPNAKFVNEDGYMYSEYCFKTFFLRGYGENLLTQGPSPRAYCPLTDPSQYDFNRALGKATSEEESDDKLILKDEDGNILVELKKIDRRRRHLKPCHSCGSSS